MLHMHRCAVQVFIRNQGEEYDVFKCDSFVEDAGKWLRLMPDAGFVPT